MRNEIEAELTAIEIEEPIETGAGTVHGTGEPREERPRRSSIRIVMGNSRRS